MASICKELRRILGLTITQAIQKIGVSEPYLTQIENGTEPLTSVALCKCLRSYMSCEGFTSELLYEMLQIVETIEIVLSNITIIHKENLFRLIAELLLNEQFPEDSFRITSWGRVNGYVRALQDEPPKMFDGFRIVPKLKLTLEPCNKDGAEKGQK